MNSHEQSLCMTLSKVRLSIHKTDTDDSVVRLINGGGRPSVRGFLIKLIFDMLLYSRTAVKYRHEVKSDVGTTQRNTGTFFEPRGGGGKLCPLISLALAEAVSLARSSLYVRPSKPLHFKNNILVLKMLPLRAT